MEFFTIGYGGRSPDDLLSLLTNAGVTAVVDVRLRPDRASMGAYSLAKSEDKGIVATLARRQIAYRSLIELGNIFLDDPSWRPKYTALLDQSGDLLLEGLFQVPPPFALMCAEKSVADCHRGLIAAQLEKRGWRARHL